MTSGRLLAIFLSLAAAAHAGPQQTTIQDVLYKADGTRMNGTAVISWYPFQASDSTAVGMQTSSVSIVNGSLFVQLVPNTTAVPAQPYVVTYSSDGKLQFQETWMVPPSSTPLRVRDVRIGSTTVILPGSSGSGYGGSSGASGLTGPIAESDVSGLTGDLIARPIKGPAYGSGRVALVNASGALETVVGRLTDCVFVDGTSGPCFDSSFLPGYSDGEAPTGIVDGANVSFALAAAPSPKSSLLLFRNGMLQKAGLDYTLNGAALLFNSGAGPQPGDTLMAWYRSSPSSGAPASNVVASGGGVALTAAPQVLCSSAGAQTTSPTAVSLGTCTVPAGLLAPGDRVEVNFQLLHTGAASAFTAVLKWGATNLIQKTCSSTDTGLAGSLGVSIIASGTWVAGEYFGSVTPPVSFFASATDLTSAAIKLDVQASLAAPAADAVKLVNLTVVRYPAVSNP